MTYEHTDDDKRDALSVLKRMDKAYNDLKIIVGREGEVQIASEVCMKADRDFCQDECESSLGCGKLVALMVVGIMSPLTECSEEEFDKVIDMIIRSRSDDELEDCKEPVSDMFEKLGHLNVF